MRPDQRARLTSSRTATDAEGERAFHRISHKFSLSTEITDAVYANNTNVIARAEAISAVYDTLRSIAEGKFLSGLDNLEDHIEPARTEPEIFELKWKKHLGRVKGEFRLYYAEPELDPKHPEFVGLMFHKKDLTGSSDDVVVKQDAVISEAANRYDDDECRKASWGHVRHSCPNCLT